MLTYKGNVADKDLTAPPALPAGSGSYLVGSGATGDWADHDLELAVGDSSTWKFQIPRNEWKVWVEDESLFYQYNQEDVAWTAKNSIADYIPFAQREEDFWILTTTLIEREIADLDPEMRKIATKWDAIDEYDEDSLRGIISEMGYDYIADMFDLTNEQLQSLVNFLNLIHYLKGTKAGLLLIFRLMGVTVNSIKEWWELTYWDICTIFGTLNNWDYILDHPTAGGLWTPHIEPHTFLLDITVPEIQDDTENNIRTFCRNYVFPKLVMLTLSES